MDRERKDPAAIEEYRDPGVRHEAPPEPLPETSSKVGLKSSAKKKVATRPDHGLHPGPDPVPGAYGVERKHKVVGKTDISSKATKVGPKEEERE